MPPVVLPAAAAVGFGVALLCWSVLAGQRPSREPIRNNLTRGFMLAGSRGSARADAGGLLGRRASRVEAIARRLTPAGFVSRLERQLAIAGRPAAWPLPRLVAAKLLLGSAAAPLGFLYVSSAPGAGRLLLAGIVTATAYFTPELLLHSRGQERQKSIQLKLPDTIDQMTIAVEAGLGFESAMARAGKNGDGPLAEELVRTLQDMQVGQPRRDAFRALSERTTVTDLRRFISAVLQADAYGIAIADVLRTQAKEMRLKRRQRAEEKAMQIPVKVVFPLIMCILPTLFIVLLGPAVLGIVDMFSG